MSETHVEEPERLRLELNQARAALVQKQTVIDEMLESLDEAKFTEPELRAKLDKQRYHIKRLKKEIDDFADYRALKREQIARLQSQLASELRPENQTVPDQGKDDG